MEFNSIPFINSFSKFSSHPLFSTIVALYTLILLYAPSLFLRIALSPVLNSTGIILLSLLKLGANERSEKEDGSQESGILGSSVNERLKNESRVVDHKEKWLPVDEGNLSLYSCLDLESDSMESRFLDFVDQSQIHVEFESKTDSNHESNQTHVESKPKSCLEMECNQTNIELEHDLELESEFQETNSMEPSQVNKEEPTMEMDSKQVDTTMMTLEWNKRAPLEIIYEEEEDEKSNENDDKHAMGCKKNPSLLTYYPESETDSSSDDDFSINENWETHESVFFKWDEEEREELIEISLDHYEKRRIGFCHAEEDNLIEIDIFPSGYKYD